MSHTRRLEGGISLCGSEMSGNGNPLISIITVTRNAAATLARSIASVGAQAYHNVQYIVIDGGSTDATVDILRANSDFIYYYLSEPDGGIYAAMNKALAVATGEWLYFLGADDCLASPATIQDVIPFLTEEIDVCFGNIRFTSGEIVRSQISRKTLLHNTLHHQSVFYRMSLFDGFRYDSSFKLIADYELNLRIFLYKIPYRRVDMIIAECAADGASRTNLKTALKETNLVRRKYVGSGFNVVMSILYAGKLWLANVRH